MNKKQVTIKIKLDKEPAQNRVIVRMSKLSPKGKLIATYGLNQSAEWVNIPEGASYPDECIFLAFISEADARHL